MYSIPSVSLKPPPEDHPLSSFDVTQIFSNHSLIEKEAKRYAKNNNFIITDKPKQNLSVDCFALLHPGEDFKKVPFRGLFYCSPKSSNRARGVGCPFKICYLYHPDKGHYTIQPQSVFSHSHHLKSSHMNTINGRVYVNF